MGRNDWKAEVRYIWWVAQMVSIAAINTMHSNLVMSIKGEVVCNPWLGVSIFRKQIEILLYICKGWYIFKTFLETLLEMEKNGYQRNRIILAYPHNRMFYSH